MKEVVIVSAARTPFGKLGGALKSVQAVDLGGYAIKEALKRAKISGDQVDEVVYGMVVPAGQGQIPGRQAAIKGGIPHEVPVVTINKVCGSVLKAVTLGAQMIKAGDADVIVAQYSICVKGYALGQQNERCDGKRRDGAGRPVVSGK